MVQAVTGQDYASVLAQEVFQPLGLTQTSLPTSDALPTPFVHGYAPDPPLDPADVSEVLAAGWAWAAGGIVSTPAEANRFVRSYVTGATTNAADSGAAVPVHRRRLVRATGSRSQCGRAGHLPL